mgnify:CR=1 FL=1
MEWSSALNTRKHSFWQETNNDNDADQYEKWLGEDTPILPRTFRIPEIRGEPEEQKTIRANMAKERVRGDFRLLRMRAEKSQEKIFNTDEEMNKVLKNKASGRILEILANFWKLDCERERKSGRRIDGGRKKLGNWITSENMLTA